MKNVIGLDIGGTKITGVVYDGKSIVRELTVATPNNLSEFKLRISRLVEFLSSGKNIKAIGIGQPGIVNPKTGKTASSGNMKFMRGFNVQKFYKSLGIQKVKIDNDAHCFAIAENLLGKGKSHKNFVGVTLGTGIGGGIVLNHKLHTGQLNRAGHVGLVMADLKHDSEYYYQIARDKKNYKKLGETLGILFANIINILDMEAIILGGSIALLHHKKFLKAATAMAKKHVVGDKIMPKVLVSNLKNSGALGAALLVSE